MLVAQHAVPQVNVARRPFAGSTDEVEAIARKAPNRCDRRAPRRDEPATMHRACCRIERHRTASFASWHLRTQIGEPALPANLRRHSNFSRYALPYTCAATL
jgi:hypothetical protein